MATQSDYSILLRVTHSVLESDESFKSRACTCSIGVVFTTAYIFEIKSSFLIFETTIKAYHKVHSVALSVALLEL